MVWVWCRDLAKMMQIQQQIQEGDGKQRRALRSQARDSNKSHMTTTTLGHLCEHARRRELVLYYTESTLDLLLGHFPHTLAPDAR